MMAYERMALWPAGSGMSRAQWPQETVAGSGARFCRLRVWRPSRMRSAASVTNIEKIKNAVPARRTSALSRRLRPAIFRRKAFAWWD